MLSCRDGKQREENNNADAVVKERFAGDLRFETHADSCLFQNTEHGDRIVGWAALNIPDAEISNVFVDPASQRQGVGKAMLKHLEALAAQSDLQPVSLKATGTAIAFYLGTGYRSEQPLAANADWALLRKSL